MNNYFASYTPRNIIFAAILLTAFGSYVTLTASLNAGIEAHNHHGYEGEAAGLGIALLVLMALYLAPFVISVSILALRRGSKPVSPWVLLLGLLPTIGLAVLILYLKVASQ